MEKDKIRKRLQQLYKVCEEYKLLDLSERIESQLKLIDEPLRIMIVGEGKSGKSSLLNALVGATVAEVDYEPKTWCIGVYSATDGETYAEVVYKDNILRTTVEQAKQLMEDYEKAAEEKASIEDIVKEREIEEIRWHLNIEWPKEGMVIIDTPGFLQGRADTEVIETQIDGVEGVRFVASDGFEKYYSKADLVLWCFEATDVGAVDVKEKLESVKTQDKSIYGIVTKLDKCDSDEEREEFFQRNNSHYKKYIKQCLRSQLPPIRKKDSEEKLQKKLQLRQDTVDGIKRCIEYLLNDNKASELKLKSYETFCANIERLMAVYLEKYINFYYSNVQVYENAIDRISKEIFSIADTAGNRMEQIFSDKKRNFLIGAEYDRLWYQCGEQPQNFAFTLKAQEMNSGFLEQCQGIQKGYSKSIKETVTYHNDNLEWCIMSIGAKQEDAPQSAVFHLDIKEKELDFHALVPNIKNGFWDDFLGLFDKNGMVYAVINGLIGNYRKERTFSKIREGFVSEINSMERKYKEEINSIAYKSINDYKKALSGLFFRVNGVEISEIEEAIVKIDKVMSDLDLYSNHVPYFPYIKDNALCFARNELVIEIKKIRQTMYSEEIVPFVSQNYIKKSFTIRLENDENNISNVMEAYNGTKKVEKDILSIPQFMEDSCMASVLPHWNKIRWGTNETAIKEAYQKELEKFLEKREQLWSDYAKKALERVLGIYLKEWEAIWIAPIKQFTERWCQQCENTFQQSKTYKSYYYTPQEWDVKKYFLFDQMYNANYATYFFFQFIEKGQINPTMLPNVPVITPDGAEANAEVKRQIEMKLKAFVGALDSIKVKKMEQWDQEVQLEADKIKKSLALYFDEIKLQVSNVILPEYLEYLVAMNGSRYIKTLSDYIVACGNLSKVNLELMKGNIPFGLFGNTINFVFSDGSQIQEDIKAYIGQRTKEINKLAEEKKANGR